MPGGGPGGAGGNLSYGSVPFKDLKIDSATTLDKWGNKIMYAVSTGLTTDPANKFAPMDPANAALVFMGWQSIQGIPGDPFVWNFIEYSSPPSKGHYILISTGNLGIGGYTARGTLIEPCPAPPGTFEAENCDGDATFNLYRYGDRDNTAASRSVVAGAGYYDDLTLYSSEIPHWMWNSSSNPSDIFTDEGRVGVGVVPDIDVALDVGGNLRAETNALAVDMCDGDGVTAASADKCFASSLIAGADPNMECDPSIPVTNNDKTAMSGIATSKANCNSSPRYNPGSSGFPSGYNFTCPSNQYVIGINSNGVICGN